jgi:peptide/nickel transport system substrate-binding protein
MDQKKKLPLLEEMSNQMRSGNIGRRDFIRNAAMLGVSATTAYQLAGLVSPEIAYGATSIKRGGTLRIATVIKDISIPINTFSTAWTIETAAGGQPLFVVDTNNIVHGLLAESWELSDDMKTETINLRKDVTFNNGDKLTADDVVFSMNMWLDPVYAAGVYGSMKETLSPTGIEKVNDHQIKLHYNKPSFTVPLLISEPQTMIMNHRTYEGNFLKAPHATGPFKLDTFREGEVAIVKARNDYWLKDTDGKALPYLDQIKFVDIGGDSAPIIAAMKNDEIDMYGPYILGSLDIFQSLSNDPNMKAKSVSTGAAHVVRMHAEKKPFDNVLVRNALKACLNRQKLLALANYGHGVLGHDTHVYPGHPEYCQKPIPDYNPGKSKKLLMEAGYPNGVKVTLAIAGDDPMAVRMGEIIKQDAIPGGFHIALDTMTQNAYYADFTDLTFGITAWSHRTRGVVISETAYSLTDEGKPSSWNETHWVDEEFEALLNKAHATPDHAARRKLFCKMENIQQQRGTIGVPFFNNFMTVLNKRVMNVEAHPQRWIFPDKYWLDS